MTVTHVLEKSTDARKQTGYLLHDLCLGQTVSVENYKSGMGAVFAFADDFEIDIPMIWNYFGEIIGKALFTSCIFFSFLKLKPPSHTH